ncbi:hypothetical protein EYC80_002786 [Monilinia laxa]|uniref:Uncharacterized protein n=1 Tax=Monilinia laxa TaxID=61186 RepID=A0A5N6KBR3_MONLA|nr:hypothetical protein EYC80_002786 [Monilinia laxa]
MKKDKGKHTTRELRNETTERFSRVQFDIDNMVETVSDEGFYTPRYKHASAFRLSPGQSASNKPVTSTRQDSLKEPVVETNVQPPGSLKATGSPSKEPVRERGEITNAAKAGSRKATVEDYDLDSPDFEKPSLFPRRVMTTSF